MRLFTLAAMAVSTAAFGLGTATRARAAEDPKLSGPFVHDNLAVYFIHAAANAPAGDGPVPLTLAEALAKDAVHVRETGSVNNLEIENVSDADVFIQAGDIVKGGRQDRVLVVSMIVPAKSGPVPISSYCVEQGRWRGRGVEDVKRFASSDEALPSRAAKLAMKAPAAPRPMDADGHGAPSSAGSDTGRRQAEMWASVADVQSSLGARLGAPVTSKQSETSLQLSLENERLKATRAAYIADLADKAVGPDVVGYVFAVNGRINSADRYPTNGLFKKMWPKLLAASATEAIGESVKPTPKSAAVASLADVTAFLAAAETGKPEDQALGTLAFQESRDSAGVLFVEARKRDGAWVHRSYLAK